MDAEVECDPQLAETYLSFELGARVAAGDIDVRRAGLPAAEDSNAYMMSPFMQASNAIAAYQAIWDFVWDDYGEFSHVKSMRMYAWLLKRTGITKKQNVGMETTHKALNMGKFNIPLVSRDAKNPNDREEVFLKYYAVARMLGAAQFFVETRTPVFRYFMDLDFKQPAALPPRSMEAAAFVVCRTLRRFWPGKAEGDAFFRCMVSTTDYKEEPARPGSEAAAKVKSGVHLIWPEIFVNDAMALDIRESVIADLQDTFGPRTEPAMNHWGDVVDLTVYKGSGLRMIGSNKTVECVACKRKGVDADGKTCRACGGNKTVDAKRPYMPLCALDGAGRRDSVKEAEYLKSFYAVVLESTIRCHLPEVPDTGFRLPEGAPTFASCSGAARRAGGASGTARGASSGPAKGASASGGAAKNKIDLSSSEAQMLQVFLRSSMGGGTVYKGVGLQSLVVNAKRSKYLANVQGPNATFCLNVDRCHRSNRAYFEVTPEGCVQRCHDQSDVAEADMRYGLCRDYRSATVRLPPALLAALFPDVSAKQSAMDNLGADASAAQALSGGAEDEAAAAAMDMRHDLKMRALLAAGDQLSMELHGMEWSSTVNLPGGGESRKLRMMRLGSQARGTQAMAAACARGGLPMYAEMDPAALGSHADEALRALGFESPKAASEAGGELEGAEGAQQPVPAARRMLLDTLEVALLNQLRNAVHLAASMDLEDATLALRKGLDGLLIARKQKTASAVDTGSAHIHAHSKVRYE